MPRRDTIRQLLAAYTALAVALQPCLVFALPTGGNVAAGSAAITSSGSQTTVTQNSPRAVLDWTGFNTASGETVRFLQPSSSAIALNRISGGATSFNGALLANGNVWLMNPNGMVFGRGSMINVGGLLATTSNIANSDFMNGNYRFTPGNDPNASITNNGSITVSNGGLFAFVAPNVFNSGSIIAQMGQAILASGDSFTIDLYGDGLVNLQTSDAVISQQKGNAGLIKADGGKITLTIATGNHVLDSAINMDGLIEADSLNGKTGSVNLTGATTTSMSGTISAKGGEVETSGENLSVSGTVTAKDWLLDPNNVIIQASGADAHVTGNPFFTTTNDSAIVTTGSIETALDNGTSVTVQTGSLGTNAQAGDIEVASNITKNAGNDASLTLEAYRNMTIDTGVQISSTHNKLNVTLDADHNNNHSGSIYMASDSGITSNGGDIVRGGGSNPLTTSAYGNRAPGDTSEAFNTVYGNGIDLEGATLNAGGGNISLRGTSWNDPSTTSYYYGLLLENNSVLQTSGTSAITVTGTAPDGPQNNEGIYVQGATLQTTAGAIVLTGIGGNDQITSTGLDVEGAAIQTTSGDIQLTGTGGSGSYGLSDGVYLSGDWSPNAPLTIETQSGNITVNGTGGTGGTGNVGMWMDGGATVAATEGGNVAINGIGGNGSGSSDPRRSGLGVTMMNDGFAGGAEAIVRVHDGNLSISGTGSGGGTHSDGIFLDGLAVIDSTGAGSITLSGHRPNGSKGMLVTDENSEGPNTIGSSSTHGDITLIADSIDASALGGITTTGNVTFQPYSAATTVGVGSGTGTLAITDALLADTTFGGTLTIGASNSGDMDIHSGSAILNQGNVTFLSGGDIALDSSLAKTAGNDASLAFEAYRNITINPGALISSTSHKLNVTLDADAQSNNSGAIYMDTGSGISSNGGDITLGGGTNPLTGSAVGNSVNNAGITLNIAALDAAGGNISLIGTGWTGAGDDGIDLYASTLRTTAGDVTLHGSGYNYGILAEAYGGTSSLIQTTSGAISITGTCISGWCYGIDTIGNYDGVHFATIRTDSGTITMNGTAGTGHDQEFGILIDGDSIIEATGTGNLAINGIGGNGLAGGSLGSGNFGVFITLDGGTETSMLRASWQPASPAQPRCGSTPPSSQLRPPESPCGA
jgi:filamentous hemagglutinin family protein